MSTRTVFFFVFFNKSHRMSRSFIEITALERKISVRASRDELVHKGILLPVIHSTSLPENGKYIRTRSITVESVHECHYLGLLFQHISQRSADE